MGGPPKPETIKEFDVPQYLGDWYEIQRIPAFFQLGTSCVRATYGVSDSENPVSVHNVATSALGSFTEITGTAYVPDPQYPGELKVEFPGNKYKVNINRLTAYLPDPQYPGELKVEFPG